MLVICASPMAMESDDDAHIPAKIGSTEQFYRWQNTHLWNPRSAFRRKLGQKLSRAIVRGFFVS